MRYLFAAAIAVFVVAADFESSSIQSSWTEPSFIIAEAEAQSELTPHSTSGTASASLEYSQPLDATDGAAPIATTASADADAHAAVAVNEERALPDVICEAVKAAAEEHDIPIGFLVRLLWQESRFRSAEVSSAGAQGIAQFMPQTAVEMGLKNPFDPLQAIPASARFLRKLHDQFGNFGLAAAAYNAGGGRIEKWLSRRSSLPKETRAYVKIITGHKAEDWIEDAEKIAIRIDLPRGAPCEGVGGLSKTKDVAFVPASPTASMLAMIRKAEARISNRARKHFAMLLKRNTRGHGVAKAGKARSMIAARSTKGAKSRAIRLASRERPSS